MRIPLVAAVVLALTSPLPVFAGSPPNFDAAQVAKPSGAVRLGASSSGPTRAPAKPGSKVSARVAHRDALTGTPTFVWTQGQGVPVSQISNFGAVPAGEAAVAQLEEHAALLGVPSLEAAGARVSAVSRSARGVTVVRLRQELAGLEVFGRSLNALLDRNNALVAVSGSLSSQGTVGLPPARMRFPLPAAEAIAIAYRDLTGVQLDGSLLLRTSGDSKDAGSYLHYGLAPYAASLANELLEAPRARQVLYPLPDALVPAYYLELNTGRVESKESDHYAYVIAAADGRLLMRNNLSAHADFAYRVFADSVPPYTPWDGPSGTGAYSPHPTGVPDGYRAGYVAPYLVSLANAPFSQNDPWLPAGATVTTGNNVDAYADLVAPDNYNAGDLRPTVTAPGAFDRTLQMDAQPGANAEQIAATTTNLFYVNNWLHDWFYDSGFDEASGNAQTDNFGRGGLGNDAIRAQAQDFSGFNNANMATPADGASPRMQMYLFQGRRGISRATASGAFSGDFEAGVATTFGPQDFDTTGVVVVAQDPADAAGPSTTDGCSTLTNPAAVAGRVALIDRGACVFTLKVANAQAAGAIGVLIVDNVAGPVTDMGGTNGAISIASLRLTLAVGNAFKSALSSGTVSVRLLRTPVMDLDGTVDNLIVAHEWAHYLSNRLVGNAAGLTNQQGGSMGEGWSDFVGLLMTVRPEDINSPSNSNWSGVYSAGEHATGGISVDSAYFGIRRVPYSADMAKNALTLAHIANSTPLPTTHPISPRWENSQVHNSGEVWATMLWECYVALLRAHPFQEAQDRMKLYLVNGLKMTPPQPTFLEARDALIATAMANDPADGSRFWAAFARRGAGPAAVAPDRYSTDHEGVVQSFEMGVVLEVVSMELQDSPGSCDTDGVLDNGETGSLVLTLRNVGSNSASATTATLFSATPGVSIGNGGSMSFPTIPSLGTAQVSFPVTLHEAPPFSTVTFQVAVRDSAQLDTGDLIETAQFKVSSDEALNASRLETVESQSPNWFVDHAPELQAQDFLRATIGLNRVFYGPGTGGASDLRLYTPPLQVHATEPLVLTFKHAFDFEFDGGAAFDGAVIELSNDGGATWVDVGSAGALYNGTLVSFTGNQNPLAGRAAIVGTSPNFPQLVSASLNLGTAYAGQTVQVRFRVGSDNVGAYTGWVLDDLSFSGITNTPFTAIIPNAGACAGLPLIAHAGDDQTVPERTAVQLTGSGSDRPQASLSYSWQQLSGPGVTLSGANTAAPAFTAPEVGATSSLVLRLTVSDGTTTASDTVTVVVTHVNRAPTASAGADLQADERTSVVLTGVASDPDGTPLSHAWVQLSGPPAAITAGATLTPTVAVPEVSSPEVLTFQLTVSDGSLTASDTVAVNVQQVNRTPAVVGTSSEVDEGASAALVASASDPDGDALTFSWTQVTGAPVVVSGADTLSASFTAPSVSSTQVLSFRLTVSDGQATATQDVSVTVRQVNQAPQVNAGVDGIAEERSPTALSGSASDPDGEVLTYAWVQLSGTPVALSGWDTLTPTFTAPEVGFAELLTFRLTASDGALSSSDTVSISVEPVNRPPTLLTSSVAVDERSTASLEATATDADGDALSYAWTQVSGTPVVISGGDTANASFSTGEVSADSVLGFRVTVSDGVASVTADVSVTVRQVNQPPAVNAGLDGAAAERSTATLSGFASDPDGDTLSYAWVQLSGTPVALSGADTDTATFTAPETVSGETLTFALRVTDGQSTQSDTVEVVVSPVNRAPSVATTSVAVDERATATLVATGTDPDGDSLNYAWTQLSGPAVTLSGADTSAPQFSTPEVSADTEFTFQVTVGDGSETASSVVTVVVRQVNQAPVVDAGPDGTAAERTAVTLLGSASDPDGDSLSYGWVQLSGTPVALSGADTATASFTAPDTAVGETLSFGLQVTDGRFTQTDTVAVDITSVNRAPVVAVSSETAEERSTVSLVATATDPDGDPLVYQWEQLTGDTVTLQGAQTATLSFAAGEVTGSAVLTFRIAVSDGTTSSSQEVSVTLQNVNRAPAADAGPAVSVAGRTSVSLDGSASADPDGDVLSFGWTQVGGPWVALSGGDTSAASFTAPDVSEPTELVFRLTASDGALSTSSTVTVTVTVGENRAPVAQLNFTLNGTQTSVLLDGSGSSDPDGEPLTFTWAQEGGPAVQLPPGSGEAISIDLLEPGTYGFTLTVTDARGGSHAATVQVVSEQEPARGCSSTGSRMPSVVATLLLGALALRRRARA